VLPSGELLIDQHDKQRKKKWFLKQIQKGHVKNILVFEAKVINFAVVRV
jgi:hypothetical protein